MTIFLITIFAIYFFKKFLPLLLTIITILFSGTIDDALLSTVSISYEKVMEGNFIAEQLVNKNVFKLLYYMYSVKIGEGI